MIYLISDEHFSHKNIISLCDRPFSSVEEMNDTLISNFNLVVNDNDFIIHLGDICMGNVQESLKYIKQLNGAKHILITGNHDKPFKQIEWEQQYLDAGITKIYHGEVSLKQVLVDNNEYILYDSSNIDLCHFPFENNITLPYDEKYRKYHVKDTGRWLLHGHQHSKISMKRERMFDCGVDANNFKPVSLDDIVKSITNYV